MSTKSAQWAQHPAFPRSDGGYSPTQVGMTLRDYFAAHAPRPRDEDIDLYQRIDKSRNPHNEPRKPKMRSRDEIIAMLRFQYADAMLAARDSNGKE